MIDGNPLISVISAVYDVDRYLPDFIKALDAQTCDMNRIEIIAVDDGSTDDSLATLRQWQKRCPELVRVLTKDNGGQASARNMGIAEAKGKWLTFIDPDDYVEPDYFAAVLRAMTRFPDVAMIAAKRLIFEEAKNEVTNMHPLRWMHHRSGKDRVRNLDKDSSYFFGHAPSAFVRADVVRRAELTFDSRIRPNFEDGHFCIKYLIQTNERTVAYLNSARYVYRKRADGTSTLQNSVQSEGRMTDVLEYGYLDALRSAERVMGSTPVWVQNFILYELKWYFSSESRIAGNDRPVDPEVLSRFYTLLEEIAHELDPSVVQDFHLVRFRQLWKDVLLHGFDEDGWVGEAYATKKDPLQNLTRVVYRYTGVDPMETFLLGGQRVFPVHEKRRNIRLFDRTWMQERTVWLPGLGHPKLEINGKPHRVKGSSRSSGPVPLERRHSRKTYLTELRRRNGLRGRLARSAYSVLDHGHSGIATRIRARSRANRERFKGAWVFVDRMHNSDDSAEVLFRHIRAHHRDKVNAWFVVEDTAPDWRRLIDAGYQDRMVAFGSDEWKMLMLNCDVLASSHADSPLQWPPAIAPLRAKPWDFVFLQHGVIKDDLSSWLNPKSLSLFVTSTHKEYESIVGDGNSYVYTSKETKLTELPRFDAIRKISNKFPAQKRDLVLVGPTWRNWLVDNLDKGSQLRQVRAELHTSDYLENWLGFLASEQLKKVVDEHELQLALLPHPNLMNMSDVQIPAHVQRLSFDDPEFRSYFARSRLFVTDYSSMAFNCAYIERPVMYFQFDTDLMFGGAHVGRGGYFQYEKQGYGPVTFTLDQSIAAAVTMIGQGPEMGELYRKRVQDAFPFRDGKASERVYQEMRRMRGLA